jgi:hypothetical protein
MGGVAVQSDASGGATDPRVRQESKVGGSFARVLVGRLVEVRVYRLADIHDVERLNAEAHAAIRRAGPGAVVYGDHRDASPLARDVADVWARGMREANRNISRSAILLDPDNTTFNLQLERVVRCAGYPARLIFSAPAELQARMETYLSGQERDALLHSLYERDRGSERV